MDYQQLIGTWPWSNSTVLVVKSVKKNNLVVNHLFGFYFAEEACIQLELEVDAGSSVSEEQFNTAARFGLELEQDSTDVKKYL